VHALALLHCSITSPSTLRLSVLCLLFFSPKSRKEGYSGPGRVRVLTNGTLGPVGEELGVLKKLFGGMRQWCVESLTDLAYTYLQMHVHFACDSSVRTHENVF
jgi:hypothetical protein